MCREKNTFLRYFNRNCVETLDREVLTNIHHLSLFVFKLYLFIIQLQCGLQLSKRAELQNVHEKCIT